MYQLDRIYIGEQRCYLYRSPQPDDWLCGVLFSLPISLCYSELLSLQRVTHDSLCLGKPLTSLV